MNSSIFSNDRVKTSHYYTQFPQMALIVCQNKACLCRSKTRNTELRHKKLVSQIISFVVSEEKNRNRNSKQTSLSVVPTFATQANHYYSIKSIRNYTIIAINICLLLLFHLEILYRYHQSKLRKSGARGLFNCFYFFNSSKQVYLSSNI